METNPLSVTLVKKDSKDNRILFRYPYVETNHLDSKLGAKPQNRYSCTIDEEPVQLFRCPSSGLSDQVLAELLTVKPELYDHQFELKINNVRFIGHPTLFPARGLKEINDPMMFHVAFCLQAQASQSVVKCYYDLSKRIGIALCHGERRSGFLSEQIKIMLSVHDEVSSRSEKESGEEDSPYEAILQSSTLARDLKSIFTTLSTRGTINILINKWIQISFCLPEKIHQSHKKGVVISAEMIERCLKQLRPYHGLLLLVEQQDLLESLPVDASPALKRLIQIYSPLKSMETLAADSDLALAQVFQLAGHLVYWAKARIIYPLCESNVYVVAPDAVIERQLIETFPEKFSGLGLLQVLSEFSQPVSISQKMNPLDQQPSQLSKTIIWLLKHHLLLQLQTYVQYIKPAKPLISLNPVETTGHETIPNFGDLEKPDSLFVYPSNDISIPSEDLILLDKLYKLGHFNGSRHLEEIMYSENLRRSHLLQILDKFRNILITFQHEDTAVTLFHSHMKS